MQELADQTGYNFIAHPAVMHFHGSEAQGSPHPLCFDPLYDRYRLQLVTQIISII